MGKRVLAWVDYRTQPPILVAGRTLYGETLYLKADGGKTTDEQVAIDSWGETA